MTTQDLINAVRKVVAPLERRVRLMVARGVINRVTDTTKTQTVQVNLLADEVRDGVERPQQYGFTSRPFAGAEAVFLAVGGSRDHGVIVATDDRRYRPLTLAEGEVALYTHQGILVVLKVGQVVELGPSPTDFVALAPNTENRLAALESFALQHMHPTAALGPPSVATPPPVLNTPPAPVAATKVKAK